MTQTPAADIVERVVMHAGICGRHHDDNCQSCRSARECTDAEIDRLHAEIEALRARETELQALVTASEQERYAKCAAIQRKLDEAVKGLEPVEREIDRLERSFGFDRPNWQYQTLMLQLGDLLVIRAFLASIRGETE